MRNKTKEIRIGNIKIGGNNPVAVQSMVKVHPANTKEAINQIIKLTDAGCDIVRIAVPNMEGAEALSEIKKETKIPLVADIHFDYRLALEAIKRGVDKIRLNPSNIKSNEYIKKIVLKAKERDIPIRVGANIGSLKGKFSLDNEVDELFKAVEKEVSILENLDFYDIVLSAKCSDISLNYNINKRLSNAYDYPIHIGITEAGTLISGIVKSSIGTYNLLSEGIGDTIRISLTGELENEVISGISLLKILNLREGVDIVSCPTCGRAKIDVKKLSSLVEKKTTKIRKNIKVAIMGCEVNGPGEARDADIGIAGSGSMAVLFENGEIAAKGSESQMLGLLIKKLEVDN
jgi:(E)-4-hydroxy-3-methylbut-2-enyl-diphosphate synthase